MRETEPYKIVVFARLTARVQRRHIHTSSRDLPLMLPHLEVFSLQIPE